jgi:hypothetical protein
VAVLGLEEHDEAAHEWAEPATLVRSEHTQGAGLFAGHEYQLEAPLIAEPAQF